MSKESKWKVFREWFAVLGTVAALVGVALAFLTARNATIEQQRFLERQTRVFLAEPAYKAFIDDLVGENTRIPVALYGSEEVFNKFLALEETVSEKTTGSLADVELQQALLALLNAIRVDALGEDQTLTKGQFSDLLDLPLAQQ